MKLAKVLCTLPVVAVLVFSAASRAQDATVSPKEIQTTWVGKSVIALIGAGPTAGKTINLQLKADGSASVEGAATDSGTWRLSEQGYCATWKHIRAGQERCFTVVRKGAEVQVLNPDGSLNSTVTQIQ